MIIMGPDGPVDSNNLPKDLKTLLGFLGGNMPTPRDKDHGWWNCEGCRDICHAENIKRVRDGFMTDARGEYFPLEYLTDMMKYFEGDTDVCIDIAVILEMHKQMFYEGVEVPETKYY